MPGYPIVDAHVHLTDLDRLSYPWMRAAPALLRAWTLADFSAASQAVAVERLVFLEVDVAPAQRVEEAQWVAGLAATDARVGGIVASAAVERGRAIAGDLDALQATGLLSGVRRLIQDEPDPRFCVQPEFLDGLRLLGERGIPFDICCFHHQLPAVAAMVRACPGTSFVLDHLGKPAVRDGLLDPWRADLDRLAKNPNVRCKISGLATEARHDAWTEEQLLPYIRHAAESFGDGRILFGSDWFVSTLAIEYARWVSVVEAALAGWPDAALRRFWNETAREVYKLDLHKPGHKLGPSHPRDDAG